MNRTTLDLNIGAGAIIVPSSMRQTAGPELFVAIGAPPLQLDDTLKPTGYGTPVECWLRTSVIVREVATRENVTYARSCL